MISFALPFLCVLLTARQACSVATSSPPADQQPLGRPFHIAIIGAGITGSSAAFHIRGLYPDASDLIITIYEKNSEVGGRIKRAYPVDFEGNLKYALDVGAPYFSEEDSCVISLANQGDLHLKPAFQRPSIWNGNNFHDSRLCQSSDGPLNIESLRYLLRNRGYRWCVSTNLAKS